MCCLIIWPWCFRRHITLVVFICTLLALGYLPVASASSGQSAFPDVTFKVFSDFVHHHFSTDVSLATVLTVLFTMTSNPELLNLYAHQQNPPSPRELRQINTGWIKALARALKSKLGDATDSLLSMSEETSSLSDDRVISSIGLKLDSLSKVLNLYPCNKKGDFLGALKPVTEHDIEPAHVICPQSMECETRDCQSCALLNKTRDQYVASGTLIKGTRIFSNVPVLVGHCPQCNTGYHSDYERAQCTEGTWTRQYLNSARYLKVGQTLWVDHIFSEAVLNGVYHFHASTSAFANFWNASFWTEQCGSRRISCRQVWHTFVQESVCRIASASVVDLELSDWLPINDVTKKAFEVLGEQGLIRSADGHTCSECTHEYKQRADIIPEVDAAAIAGVDEHHNVPAFGGQEGGGDMMNDQMDIDDPQHMQVDEDDHSDQDEGSSPVKMIVMDGIVMGNHHCAFENCTSELANAQRGVFCEEHEATHGHLCRVKGCQNPKARDIHTCYQHQALWRSHVLCFGHSTPLGIR
jgi:hypothetical protein